MKNIVTRAVSGTIYVAVIVSATIAGGYWFLPLPAYSQPLPPLNTNAWLRKLKATTFLWLYA